MDQINKVEKLRQKANISYEEAKAALERSNWDLLDALVDLESQGKLEQEQKEHFTTRPEPQPQAEQGQDFRGSFTKFFAYIAELINKANVIQMDVTKRGKVVLSMPLTVLLLLLVFLFWWVLPAMTIGLFLGFRYSFRGHKVTDNVNKAMDKAAQAAENLKSNINRDEGQEGRD